MLFTFADQVMSWYVNGNEQKLGQIFLDEGYEGLREELDPKTEEEWEVVKDNFVIFSGVLILLVVKNMTFFLELLAKGKGKKIRTLLQIEDKKYDDVWAVIMDVMLDGFCKKKMAERTLEQITALLEFYEV
jgi:hypothetical protein